ncbi:hypothetical protein AUR64_18710 [Haloprofundus marisrubri]|uniref:DUF7344 domain-containing protein n=1 Tax=Haloprofundus marisrubri TaxID=1514971 RepID=A0A0W1R5P4_9EURY|nr:hypothetical protein [Haloprofundus marisrubri]KTG08696.1 hypothetical protein AUR64_18710 [Haloprofundus marisrubri]
MDSWPETKLTLDKSLVVLSNKWRRRLLLKVLKDNPRDEREFASDAANSSETQELDALRTQLRHVHLPLLEEEGLINWNRDDGTITRGENFEEIRPLLELMREHSDELPNGWL